jgi:hypothetical protein
MSLITAHSALISAPRAAAAQAEAYIVARGSSYKEEDIRSIVGYYWRFGSAVGLDPLVAIAQCIYETSEYDPATGRATEGRGRPLSSWWSQPPRRNPANIGVTGEARNAEPVDHTGWAKDTRFRPPKWRAGLSFDSWETAVRAHTGRLLAFAIPVGRGTRAQKEMLDFALGLRPLNGALRGSAPTLRALGARHNPTGQGWAAPGDRYGAAIAAIAQAIRE